MKKQIFNALSNENCCECGVVKARIFTELLPILKKRGSVSLAEADFEKRINPFLLMDGARSIVVCLFSYFTNNKSRISEYAMGADYHNVICDKLSKAKSILLKNGYRAESYADNSPLCDRYLAYLAGLGFFGKNGMLINEKHGSMVFIGYIITDCPLDEDKPLGNTYCIGCGKCIKSCPGGAIGDDFSFDENKCASFLTQKKGELSRSEEEIIRKSGYIWGCDICQTVCPYNYSVPVTKIREFSENQIKDIVLENVNSNREFKEKYPNRAFVWRGKAVIERNIKLYN